MIEPSGIIASVADVREAHLCVRGMKEWAKLHGFDFEKFVREGLPVEDLEATGDHFALVTCEIARRRAAGKVDE